MSDIDIRSGLSEDERLRLEKIDRLDANKTRKKVIIAVVTVILVLFFVLGTAFGAKYILSYEGTQSLPADEIIYPDVAVAPDEVVASFVTMLNDTKNYNGVKLNVGFDVNIPDENIVITGEKADAIRPYIDYVKSSFIGLISDEYASQRYSGAYGEDFSGVLFDTSFLLHLADISSQLSEENENDLRYVFDYYDDAVNEPVNSIVFEGIFDISSDTVAKNNVIERLSSMIRTSVMKIAYSDFVMTVNVDRLNNQINSIHQHRAIDVSLPVTFIGDFEEFGEINIAFTIELNKTYSFTRADFYFTEDVYYVEKGSSDEFKYKVISDESPADVVVTLTSSDPSVLSVDGRFYKANKVSDKSVTVTAQYTYNGITYTDTCEFYVIVPVEGVKQNEKEVTLKRGEKKTLGVTVSPDDATLTKVYWFSSDESIVTVDENGEITAVSAGTALVYCITLDGNFKASCAVSITE